MTVINQIIRVLTKRSGATVHKSARELAEIIDPSFVYINSRGKRQNKRQYLEQFNKPRKMRMKSQRYGNIEIQDFDSFVIVTMIVHDKFELDGEVLYAQFKSLCVFRNVEGEWLWAGGQAAAVQQSS